MTVRNGTATSRPCGHPGCTCTAAGPYDPLRYPEQRAAIIAALDTARQRLQDERRRPRAVQGVQLELGQEAEA